MTIENTVTESLVKNGSFFFNRPASALAGNVDDLFYFILWGSILFFVLIMGLMAYFVKKYRRSEKNLIATSQITHSTFLEVTWTAIPLFLVMVVFYWGYKDFLRMSVAPPGALEIRVTGKKWLWQFDYPREGVISPGELVVPVGRPVRLVMGSEDVIHSFYLPNFRIKRDVIPNRYTKLWFSPERIGVFQVFCTEYCGDAHSNMLATLRVVSEADYKAWLKSSSSTDDVPLLELGQKLYTKNACNTCHSIDGTPSVGPTWKGLYGKNSSTSAGSVVAEDAYLKESIVDPKAKIVTGFQPVMPTFAGILKDREITAIIEYIKTLK